MNNIVIKQCEPVEDIQKIAKEIFGIDLSISGGWGYDENSATVIDKLEMPMDQFTNIFATIRANIEMNITLDDENRYSAINITLIDSKETKINNKTYTVVSFKITAINELLYKDFIKEYKEGYGKKEFDLAEHFKKREENTIVRNIDYWFLGLQ